MAKPLVKIENVTYQYPSQDTFALKDVSFEIYEGEWLAIVGHNGSGKSTIAKLLNGLQFPQKGSITVNGIPINEETIWDVRKQIGMVFQNPDNQFVGTTVQDDVAFGLENSGVPRKEMVMRVRQSLQQVGMLDFLNQEPHHLSGGQKQRVAIAGVIALLPSIIILDEATSMLDPKGRNEILHTVRKLKVNSNMTVVSITHDLEEAAKADRIVILNQGQLYKEGKPTEIFQMGDKLVELGLDLPFSIKLGKALRAKGIIIPNHYLTEEELVEELWISHFKI